MQEKEVSTLNNKGRNNPTFGRNLVLLVNLWLKRKYYKSWVNIKENHKDQKS